MPKLLENVWKPVIFPLYAAVFSYFFLDRWIAEQVVCGDTLLLICKWLSKISSPFSLLFCTGVGFVLWRMKSFSPFATVLLSMFFVGNLKLFAARPRPYLYLEKQLYGFFMGGSGKGFLSFPSSHAAIAVGLATIFSGFFPAYKKWFYAGVISILLTRILLQQHFLSDLLVGGWMGYITAILVIKIEKLLMNRSFSLTKHQ
jgi:membrane-associated phospholipid phosphatase